MLRVGVVNLVTAMTVVCLQFVATGQWENVNEAELNAEYKVVSCGQVARAMKQIFMRPLRGEPY